MHALYQAAIHTCTCSLQLDTHTHTTASDSAALEMMISLTYLLTYLLTELCLCTHMQQTDGQTHRESRRERDR